MSYIGSSPATSPAVPTSQSFNGDGSTTVFTLNKSVDVSEELEVFVNNVQQEPGSGKAYTASGTTLTFSSAPSSGTGNVYVIYRGYAERTVRIELDNTSTITANTLNVGTIKDNSGTNNALAIDSSGNVALSQVGTGTFYRTGTFTPEYSSTTATDPTVGILSGTYVNQIGEYVRIGDTVHVDITLSSPSTLTYTNGGANGQNSTIVGLPFKVRNLTDYNASAVVGYYSGWASFAAGYTPMGYAPYNTKRINLVYANGISITGLVINGIVGSGSATTILSLTYQTDDA